MLNTPLFRDAAPELLSDLVRHRGLMVLLIKHTLLHTRIVKRLVLLIVLFAAINQKIDPKLRTDPLTNTDNGQILQGLKKTKRECFF
jgi:hypothetical protein